MKKVLIEGAVIIIMFFSSWLLLSQINWLKIFKVETVENVTEEKLGKLFWENIQKTENLIDDSYVTLSIDSIVNKVCLDNGINRKSIKVHIVDKNEVNAFALPFGHLLIYSGLILQSDNQEELSGVICHEIAHIQLNHVMKKLVREIGFAALLSVTTNSGGLEIIKESAKLLSSTAFDRSFEKSADIKAVEYLANSHIDPKPFADFIYKLALEEPKKMKLLTWINTHPESRERAEYIIKACENKSKKYQSLLSSKTWKKVKENLN